MAEKEYSKALEINPTDNVTRMNLTKLTNIMKQNNNSYVKWLDMFNMILWFIVWTTKE